MTDTPAIAQVTEEQCRDWLIQQVSKFTNLAAEKIDPEQPINRYGLDSSALLSLACDLEDWLNKEVEQTTLYDYPTINALAKHLVTT